MLKEKAEACPRKASGRSENNRRYKKSGTNFTNVKLAPLLI